MLFFYIRHGDPIYDPDSLTELGHKQAEALSKRLAVYGLDEIYTSSSERAKLTAEPTCKLLGITPTELDWCHEKYAFRQLTVRDDEGKRRWACGHTPTKRLFVTPEVVAMGRDWHKHPYFKDTTFSEGVERVDTEVDAFMRSLGFEHDRENGIYRELEKNDKRIALFAHQGIGLLFLSSLLDIPYNVFSVKFNIAHSSMTVIDFRVKDDGLCLPQIIQLSNDSHLYREGLPTKYNNGIPI
jgi:probable phosphoglycerate mutase